MAVPLTENDGYIGEVEEKLTWHISLFLAQSNESTRQEW